MHLSTFQETLPKWDDDKARVLGGAAPGSLPPMHYDFGDLLPGEWLRVQSGDHVVGYGWLELSWGEAEILLAVDPSARRNGVGAYILDALARETAQRGSQYMFNAVREGHPDAEGLSRWLRAHGFEPAGDGTLRRRVPHTPAP